MHAACNQRPTCKLSGSNPHYLLLPRALTATATAASHQYCAAYVLRVCRPLRVCSTRTAGVPLCSICTVQPSYCRCSLQLHVAAARLSAAHRPAKRALARQHQQMDSVVCQIHFFCDTPGTHLIARAASRWGPQEYVAAFRPLLLEECVALLLQRTDFSQAPLPQQAIASAAISEVHPSLRRPRSLRPPAPHVLSLGCARASAAAALAPCVPCARFHAA